VLNHKFCHILRSLHGGQEKDFTHPTKNLLYSIICGSALIALKKPDIEVQKNNFFLRANTQVCSYMAALLDSRSIYNNTLGLTLSRFVPVLIKSVTSKEPHPIEMASVLN